MPRVSLSSWLRCERGSTGGSSTSQKPKWVAFFSEFRSDYTKNRLAYSPEQKKRKRNLTLKFNYIFIWGGKCNMYNALCNVSNIVHSITFSIDGSGLMSAKGTSLSAVGCFFYSEWLQIRQIAGEVRHFLFFYSGLKKYPRHAVKFLFWSLLSVAFSPYLLQ